MKPIKEMTVEAMCDEMRQHKTRENEKYIFISYSHMDKEVVYPVVLGWMRKGYNVYIDLDFANHGSDEHWATMMRQRIENNDCALLAAFRSKNAAFSYPALMELLTAGSDRTTKRHRGKLPIDIIEIEPTPESLELDSEGVDKASYESYFKDLQEQVGDTFCKNNPRERTIMEEGLSSWYKQKGDELKKDPHDFYDSAEEMMETIDDTYRYGATSFFPIIASFSALWLKTFELNGNKKKPNDPMDERFENLKLKRIPLQAAEEDAKASAVTAIPVIKAEGSAHGKRTASVRKADAVDPAVPPVSAPATLRDAEMSAADAAAYPRYYTRSDNRAGTLVQTGEKAFTVLAGAEMRKDHTATCPGQYLRLREDLITRGLVFDWNDCYTLEQDVDLTSMSAAAGILVGRSVNGKDFWCPGEAPEKTPVPMEDAPLFIEAAPAEETRDSLFDAGRLPEETCYGRRDGHQGRIRQIGAKQFLILAGAEMRKDQAPSCQYLKLRQQIMDSGVLLDRGETYEFMQDYAVSSLSAAAAALTGRSVNGNDFWVKEEGLSAPSAEPFEDLFAEPHNDSAFRVSIANVRFLFEVDEDFCRRVGELRRSGLPWGGRGALDLAMAAILGGCNKVASPAQINYYKYAIADMDNKRDGEGLGATWTWSSNCRKLLYGSKAGSGKIDADTDAYYASLPEDTAVEEILEAFRQGRPFFQVEKKELVTQCLEAFMALL